MEDEKTISMRDIMRVLLGNKWVYLIMAASFALVSFIGLKLTSDASQEYVTFFDYDIAGFNRAEGGTAYFIDGEKFDPRAMITKEKLLHYIESRDSLKDLDADEIIKKNAIKSFDYSATYKENDHKMNANDAAYITDKVGYKLVLNPSYFSYEQAQEFSKAIAEEVTAITKNKIDHINYSIYLKYYDSTYSYSDKISYLNSGINYLNQLISGLSSEYGDVLIKAGKYGGDEDKYAVEAEKLSDWQDNMNVKFECYKVNTLADEMELAGYIDSRSTEYIANLKTTIENLNRDIAMNQAILDKLTSQRDDLVASIGASATIESLEIGGYNSEIIELTKIINQQKEQVERLNIQISKLDLSSLSAAEIAAYNNNLTVFEAKMDNIRQDLEFYTKQYEAIAKKVMNENMYIFYDCSTIVDVQGGMKSVVIVGASLAIGVFAPMLIDLAIACFSLGEGKPIFKAKKEK